MTFGGIFSILGSKTMGYPSAGALGCMMISCVAGTHWKKENDLNVIFMQYILFFMHFHSKFQHIDMFISRFNSIIFFYLQNDVGVKLNLLWKFVKPISFALIGKEVVFDKLDMKVVSFGIAIVLIASAVGCLP